MTQKIKAGIKAIVDGYRQINELYELMRETYTKQQQLLEEERVVEANKQIGKRDELISKIDGINAEIAELKQMVVQELGIEEFNFTNLENKLGEGELESLKTVSSKTKALVQEIIDLDTGVMKTYKSKLEGIKGKLKGIKNGKKAMAAYKVYNSHARFMDRKK